MANITYTPDQQAQIDAFQKAITTATTALTNAHNAVTSAYGTMQNAYGAGGLAQPNCYSGQASLSDQLAIGNMDKKSCKRYLYGYKTVLHCKSCPDAVDTFNGAYADWKYKQGLETQASAAVTTAQNNLSNYYKSLGLDPNVVSQQNNALAAASTLRTKWILFGLIVLAIVVAAIFFAKKSI